MTSFDPFLHFFVGLLACFIGTIPFGPINLTVVKTTVERSRRQGMEVAAAASIVEVMQASIAIFFGMMISDFLESNVYIKLGLAALFIVLGIIVLLRKSNPSLEANGEPEQSSFKRGLLIAALNPQAAPFWIFALATISQYFTFQYVGICLVAFLGGVFVGKVIALSSFVVASGYLKSHLKESSAWVNRLLAVILIFIGLSQLWNAYA